MLFIVAVFGLIIVMLSAYGYVTPRGYVAFAKRFEAGPGIWGGFALRGALAVLLWLSAAASLTPTAFKVLAVLSAVGAVFLPILGQERFRRLIEWGAEQPTWILRSLCLLGIALGLFLLWSSVGGLGY